MNINTHIYPEYVVSFRMSSGAQGAPIREESRLDVSGVTSQGSEEQLDLNKLPSELVNRDYVEGKVATMTLRVQFPLLHQCGATQSASVGTS
ncbi:hypothetical protein A4A49_12350 [Nicotiana attenuata]|uniref:Uncharacterized protein n=1 Tax=Nicotiana attenuata TaxID=49451 RepID=A0A314KNG9_NICAT|nr:hypothetical protein A4A49_12350 [Nicotiana attenuata]